MRSYLEAALRGIVQGLTEFLPISSSGHLFIMNLLGFENQSLFFDILLHISTLIAIVVIYRKSILNLIRNPLSEKTKFVLVATVPTAILAGVVRYFLYDYTKVMLPFCFMVTTVMLASTKIAQSQNMALKWNNGYTKTALLAGVAQGVASLTGVSRSGSVITVLRHLGLEKEESSELTFLLSIPIILGSAIVEIVCYEGANTINIGEAVIAMIFAFMSGILAIKTFIKVLNNDKIWIFSIYTFLLSCAGFYLVFFRR
ncbi:MAG TPA: undecaprenyl-diphosphate phosphatase [Clostridia bacterium]|nr:undecaprenyl-diphosphate phosphatase [Clostridia bacterium]